MSTSHILMGGLIGTALTWVALVGYSLANRALHDRLMRRLDACFDHGTSTGSLRSTHVGQVDAVLRRSARSTLYRLVADSAQPEILRDQVAALILRRYRLAPLVRDAARGPWFSRRWRRIVAWQVLYRTRACELHPMLLRALRERDKALTAAAVVMLGMIRDQAAAAILVEALRSDACAPACIAMQFERFSEAAREETLSPLLNDPQPLLRFWAVCLLSRHRTVSRLDARFAAHVSDPDPRVRKAVAQAMGEIGGPLAAEVAVGLLSDEIGFVRAHAVRSLMEMAGETGEMTLSRLLLLYKADPDWWVRLAVREALYGKGARRILRQPRAQEAACANQRAAVDATVVQPSTSNDVRMPG